MPVTQAPRTQTRRPPLAKEPAASARATARPQADGDAPAPVAWHRRKKVWAALALLALVIVALPLVGGINRPPAVNLPPAPNATPAADLSVIPAPGLVESAGGLRALAFPIGGQIKMVFADENERVTKGQVLAELVADDLAARVESARARVDVARAERDILVQGIETEIEQARQEVARTQAERSRLKAGPRAEEIAQARAAFKSAEVEWQTREDDHRRYLANPDAVTRQQIDMTRGLAQMRKAECDAARARLQELEGGYRVEDLAQAAARHAAAEAELAMRTATRAARLQAAQARLVQAGADLALAQAELEKTRLRSPIDGVLVSRYRHPGETVGMLPPEIVVTVASLADLQVRADVDEAHFALVTVGTPVSIKAEAYGDRAFAGTVRTVSTMAGEKRFSTGEATERRDVKIVETIIAFDEPPPFKLGQRVTAYIGNKPSR